MKFGKPWIVPGKKHVGIDLNRYQPGDKVYSYQKGKVKYLEYTEAWGYGIVIESKTPSNKPYCHIYWHLRPSNIKIGDTVKCGQKIGVIDAIRKDMCFSVPHLHFGLCKGKYVPGETQHGGIPNSKFPGRYKDPMDSFQKWGWI